MSDNERFQLLTESDLDADPFVQFQKWWKLAHDKISLYPDYMVLSTLNSEGYPDARVVLLKGVNAPYFQFFTNYNSQKAQHLQNHPKASLLFFWKELGKQIRIQGEVSKCQEHDSDNYWNTRHRESQLHAWASAQSSPIASYEDLLKNVKAMEDKFKDQIVPRPAHWGGLQLQAQKFEFWQEGHFRLHHRFTYEQNADQQWSVTRLNP